MSDADRLDSTTRTSGKYGTPLTHAERLPSRIALSASPLVDALWDPTAALNGADVLFAPASSSGATTGTDGGISNTPFAGYGQTVAVIDTGIAYDHLAFSSDGASGASGSGFGPGYRVVGGWDFAENDADPYDDGPAGYHGTHVASIIGGNLPTSGSTSNEFSGIASAVDLVALRVVDDFGQGKLSWVESALQWVIDNENTFESPITAVNLSLGATLDAAELAEAQATLEDEFAILRDRDILVFAAAGNQFDASQPEEVLYPASSPNVVAVAATESTGELASFSHRQSNIYAAPGTGINGAVPEHVFGYDGVRDDLALISGTSMASPALAAASVLAREQLISEGLGVDADSVLQRLHEWSSESTDATTGITFHSVDTNNIDQWLATSPSEPTVSQSNIWIENRDAGQAFELNLTSSSPSLTVDGESIDLNEVVNSDGVFVIDAGGGSDSLVIHGSSGTERLTAQHGQAIDLESDFGHFQFDQVESLVLNGGGGSDRTTLFDSPGNDTLTTTADEVSLSGTGFEWQVNGVSRTFVHATAGGEDIAFLHDSSGDDQLQIRPEFTSLRSGDTSSPLSGTFRLAYGFDKVFAYGGSGGSDSIEIRDSIGDDVISLSTSRTVVAGPGYHVTAVGFDELSARGGGGGSDEVRIYTDAWAASESGSNSLDAETGEVRWIDSSGNEKFVRGFENTSAIEGAQVVRLEPGWRQGLTQLEQITAEEPPLELLSADWEERRNAVGRALEWFGEEES
ncbi:MAG: S8 family serine peptidase [Planctomycetota bacterium]